MKTPQLKEKLEILVRNNTPRITAPVSRHYDENFMKANRILAKIYLREGNKEKAIEHYEQAKSEFYFMSMTEALQPQYLATGQVLRGFRKLHREIERRWRAHKNKLVALGRSLEEDNSGIEMVSTEIGNSNGGNKSYMSSEEVILT